MFNVILLQNSKTRFCGHYLLRVTTDALELHATLDGKTCLVSWKVEALRRYGQDDGKFSFEAGRSAETGEGMFVFQTDKADMIYKQVHAIAQTIAAGNSKHRRQHTNAAREGSVLIVSQPIVKSHKSRAKPKDICNDVDDADLYWKDPKLSSIRAPVPRPRPPKGLTKSESGNSNEVTYSEPKAKSVCSFLEEDENLLGFNIEQPTYSYAGDSDREPSVKEVSSSLDSTKPSSVYNLSSGLATKAADHTVTLDYIYEEKGLSQSFRQFLKERKDQNC